MEPELLHMGNAVLIVLQTHSLQIKSKAKVNFALLFKVNIQIVMRRDQEYVGRKMMEMELPGKRKRGRPKKRFLDVVKEDMGEVGAKETDVENRTVWRKMIRCGYP